MAEHSEAKSAKQSFASECFGFIFKIVFIFILLVAYCCICLINNGCTLLGQLRRSAPVCAGLRRSTKNYFLPIIKFIMCFRYFVMPFIDCYHKKLFRL